MGDLIRVIRCHGGVWAWLRAPVWGVVRNPSDLGVYCGWFVLWFDWSDRPLLGKRVSFDWDNT